jgi:predicted heme/steroid binding protein
VFTRDQLSLFDGSRHSKPIYLALLGRVYNVNKGEKHYGVGGSYNIFAGHYS